MSTCSQAMKPWLLKIQHGKSHYTFRNWMLLSVLKSDEFEIKSREPHVEEVRLSSDHELNKLQNKSQRPQKILVKPLKILSTTYHHFPQLRWS